MEKIFWHLAFARKLLQSTQNWLGWPSCNTEFKNIPFLHMMFSEAVAPGEAAPWLYLQI